MALPERPTSSSEGERDGALVLIVDDDEGIRVALRDALEEEGFKVAVAVDGVDGLQQLRAGCRPRCVLLDHMMPNMDGAGFVDAVRADAALSGLPIILITADGRAREKADALGLRMALKKPVKIEALLDAIADA